MSQINNKKEVHGFFKSVTDKSFKSSVDLNWLKYHSEVARYNPELKKLKKADFLVFAKVSQACGFEDFEKFLNTKTTAVKLSKSESESLKHGFDTIVIALSLGLDMLQIITQKPEAVIPEEIKKAA